MKNKVTINGQYGKDLHDKKIWSCVGYVRVSTEFEMQTTSYLEQIQYLENKIKSDPDKTFEGIYADRGSGRSTTERPEFLRMMEDARVGKFNMILCKSVSRFGRNLADFTEHMRELRSLGIRVKFEKEGLDSINPRMDFLMNIFEILAQEESNSQSENIKWAHEKRLSQGIAIRCRPPYGYRREEDTWFVVDNQARHIKKAYEMFLEGRTKADICRELITLCEREGMPEKWTACRLLRAFQNQNYTGDYIAYQYVIVKDPVTGLKRAKLNTGQRAKYIIPNHHDAIISKEDFWKAQELLGDIGVKNRPEEI